MSATRRFLFNYIKKPLGNIHASLLVQFNNVGLTLYTWPDFYSISRGAKKYKIPPTFAINIALVFSLIINEYI